MKTKNITNRERFLNKLKPYLSEEGLDNVGDAYVFAKYGHRGQERDGGGGEKIRYFEHPRAVAEIIIDELGILGDWRLVVLALLHDVIEDTWLLNHRRVKKLFGEEMANWLVLLTRVGEHSDAEWEAYIGRIGACGEWRVILVKLCDRLHNLRTCTSLTKKRQAKYIAETEKYFFGLIQALYRHIPKVFADVSGKVGCALQTEIANLKTSFQEEKCYE